jgi:para-nitrobenzyl esterase
MVTGCNQGEGGASPVPEITLAEYRKNAADRYKEMADEFLELYQANSDAEARKAQNDSSWDQARASVYLWALKRARTSKTKVYTYFWDHALPGPDSGKYGAFHTSEVPYVLDTLYMSDRPFTAADRKIADLMSSYWANFIATGDPNGKGLPHWPAIGEKPGYTMETGDHPSPIAVAGSEVKLRFFEKFFAKSQAPPVR